MKGKTKPSDRLLISEYPLSLLPSLAKALGVEKALILQQLNFVLGQPKSGRMHDGHKWVWNTYQQWCDDHFKWMKPDTLYRHMAALEKMGLVVSAQLDRADWDRTKYYRIDRDALDRFLVESLGADYFDDLYQTDTADCPVSNTEDLPGSSTEEVPGSSAEDHPGSLYRTETSTETTPETSGVGVKTLASNNTVATIASGSALNGAGSKAKTNGNGAAPTIPSGSHTTASQPTANASVDATTYQALVDHLASACGWAPLVAKGKQPATRQVTEGVADLIDLGITTVEAMKVLIGLWEEEGKGWRKVSLTPEALVKLQSKKQQEIKDQQAKEAAKVAQAADPDPEIYVTVVVKNEGRDGSGKVTPLKEHCKDEYQIASKMRRSDYEKMLAQGYLVWD